MDLIRSTATRVASRIRRLEQLGCAARQIAQAWEPKVYQRLFSVQVLPDNNENLLEAIQSKWRWTNAISAENRPERKLKARKTGRKLLLHLPTRGWHLELFVEFATVDQLTNKDAQT